MPQQSNLSTKGNLVCHLNSARRPQIDELRCGVHCAILWFLERAGLAKHVMVDCSHANSNKDHTRQAAVCREVAAEIASGDRRINDDRNNIVAGAQKLQKGKTLT